MTFLWLLLGVIAGMVISWIAASGVLRWQPKRRRSGPYRKLIDSALAQVAAGDHRSAARSLREATQLRSGDDSFYLLLGEQLRQSGDPSRAERILEVLLAKRELGADTRSAAWLLRGRLLEAEGESEKAIAAYRAAVEAAPKSAPPLVALGRLLSARRRWSEAIDAADQLARLDAGRGKLIAARRRVLLARETVAEGDPSVALELAEKAIRHCPDLAAAHLTAGDARYQLGQIAPARESWIRAAELAPWLAPSVLDRLEGVATATGDRDAARRFALAQVERGLDEDAGWRVPAWLADDALRRDALGQAREWLQQLEGAAAGTATASRLRLRLAAAEDGMHAGPTLLRSLQQMEDEALWVDRWRCRRCGDAAEQMEFRCPRCQAWESFR